MSEEKKKRGRPRKIAVTDNPEILSDDAGEMLLMSEKSVKSKDGSKPLTTNDVVESLASLYSSVLGTNSGGVFTNLSQFNLFNPFLQNERLKQINSYPSSFTPSDISEALQNPQDRELMLQSASSALSASQYLYYKMLREACDIPMFKYYTIPENLTKSEYLTKEFVEEENFVNDWLDQMHVASTFRKISMEVKREGKPSYVFRQCIEEVKGKKRTSYATFQKLPPAYTKLTGIGKYGYITSFNMLLFLQPAFSPKQYPKYIQDIWDDLIKKSVVTYNSREHRYEVKKAANLYNYSYTDEQGTTIKGTVEIQKTVNKTTYMYWVQLPQDLCFCFASDMSNAWAVPDTIGVFTSLQELSDYSTLAGLVQSTPLTAVLTGQVEFIDGAQPGQDQTKLSPHTLEAFENSFNQMVSSNINAYFGPFKDMKLQSLPNVPNSSDIKTKAVQNFITTAGEGGLIPATDKPSVAAIKAAQIAAEAQYDFVVRQIEDVVNAVLKKWCDCKYEWKIKFWGGIYTFENKVKLLKEMVASGATFLLPDLASAFDKNMNQLKAISSYVDAREIYKDFKTLGWASNIQNQTPEDALAGDKTVGRKTIDDNDIENDSTAQSKETGANISELKTDYAQSRIGENICIMCGEHVEDGQIVCEDCREEYGIEGGEF